MRTLRILAVIGVVLAALAVVLIAATGFWLNLAARHPPVADVPVPHVLRNDPPLPRPHRARGRFHVAQVGDRARIVDSDGRVVVLRGANIGLPGDPAPHNAMGQTPSVHVATLRALGFNALRIPVSWQSLETDEGGLDLARFYELKAILNAARAHDMVVILATHHAGVPSEPGAVGLPQRTRRDGLTTPAFEPGPSGLYNEVRRIPLRLRWWADFLQGLWTYDHRSLQDHLIDVWVRVMPLFRGHPALLGVTPIHAPLCFPRLFGTAFSPGTGDCPAAVADFYARFMTAIRAMDGDVMGILEPPVSGSPWGAGRRVSGWTPPDLSGIAVGWNAPDRVRDVPTSDVSRTLADSGDVPVLFVEPGFDHPTLTAGSGPTDQQVTRWLDLLDAGQASGFLWVPDPAQPPAGIVAAHSRPYPLRIAGIPEAWAFHKGVFTLRYHASDATNFTRVFVPPSAFGPDATWDDLEVTISDGTWSIDPRDKNVLVWKADASVSSHRLQVRPRPNPVP